MAQHKCACGKTFATYAKMQAHAKKAGKDHKSVAMNLGGEFGLGF
jgi:hypothetical protein